MRYDARQPTNNYLTSDPDTPDKTAALLMPRFVGQFRTASMIKAAPGRTFFDTPM